MEEPCVESQILCYLVMLCVIVFCVCLGCKKTIKYLQIEDLDNPEREGNSKPLIESSNVGAIIGFLTFLGACVYTCFCHQNAQTFFEILLGWYAIFSLAFIIQPIIESLFGNKLPPGVFHFTYGQSSVETEYIEKLTFTWDYPDIISWIVSTIFYMFCITSHHWFLHDILVGVMCITSIAYLRVPSMKIAMGLIGCVVTYDLLNSLFKPGKLKFNLDGEWPIRFILPFDIGGGNNYAIVPIGDVIVMGILLSLLLRYDTAMNIKSSRYFSIGLFGFGIALIFSFYCKGKGLLTTSTIMVLGPINIFIILISSLTQNRLSNLFEYKEIPNVNEAGA